MLASLALPGKVLNGVLTNTEVESSRAHESKALIEVSKRRPEPQYSTTSEGAPLAHYVPQPFRNYYIFNAPLRKLPLLKNDLRDLMQEPQRVKISGPEL
jgi:hypothetical protein